MRRPILVGSMFALWTTWFIFSLLPADVHAQAEIRCDGRDQTRGTLTYACAMVDNDLLESLGVPVPPQARGKGYQVWLRTSDASVLAFRVSMNTLSDAGTEDQAIRMVNVSPNREFQSIAVFMVGRQKIASIRMEELRPVSSIDW